MITPIQENEGGKATLKRKLNEVIELLNKGSHQTTLETPPVVPDHVDIPVVYNGEEPRKFEHNGFTASPVPGYINAPSGGYTDDTGSTLVGMLKLDRVPADVRAAYHEYLVQE